MQKIILIIAGAILLIGVGYFAAQQAGLLPTTVQKVTIPNGAEQETITGSIQNLLSRGESLKCTWSTEEASGTSWIKNQNVYSEVTAQEQTSKTIMKDNCAWVWMEGQAQGIKTCYESFDEMQQDIVTEDTETEPAEGSISLPANVTYNCAVTTIEDSKFNPPQDVQFMDLEETLPAMEDIQDMSQEELEQLQQQMEDMVPEGM